MVNIANTSLYRCDNVWPCRLTGNIISWRNYFHSSIADEHIKNQVGSLLPSSSYFSPYECKSSLSLHLNGPSTPEWFEYHSLLVEDGWQRNGEMCVK